MSRRQVAAASASVIYVLRLAASERPLLLRPLPSRFLPAGRELQATA